MADDNDLLRHNISFLDKTYGEPCFSTMFNGIRLASLLSSSSSSPLDDFLPFTSLPPEYNTGVTDSSLPETFCFFSEDYPALSSQNHYQRQQQQQQQSAIEVLPDLHYFEDINSNDFPVSITESESSLASPLKRIRRDETPVAAADYTLDAIVRSFKPKINNAADDHSSSSKAPMKIPAAAATVKSSKVRKHREKIGEKVKCVQELMPWRKKMTMATLLEEAYKYIKFLQAQISALKSMPCESSFNVRKSFTNGGELGMLNRQELLQLLINSKTAQTMMYSQNCCVFSIEQYWLIKNGVQKRYLMQHRV